METLDGIYNRAVFEKLEPDTPYSFKITDKKSARAFHKGKFKTLAPPPGDFLFRFATINDIHVGEKIAGWLTLPGLEFIPLTPGFKMEIDGKPYWRFTNETVIDELNRLDLDFVIVKGDLTAEHTEEQMATAKEMLDKLKHPYHVLRGNHDRRGGQPSDRPRGHFRRTFGLEKSWYSFEHRGHAGDHAGSHAVGHAFILLDCVHPLTGFASFSREELDWLEKELDRLRDARAFVYLHNPPFRFLERAFMRRRARFLRALDTHPRLAGVFYGHTHANRRSTRRYAGRDVPFVETAATVEYPGGYNVYDVHSGGYTQTCLRPHDARCYRWYAMTEREFHGLAPLINFGRIEDRNFSWIYPE
ncbi:MAG: metallophosphoesterase [bacterium]